MSASSSRAAPKLARASTLSAMQHAQTKRTWTPRSCISVASVRSHDVPTSDDRIGVSSPHDQDRVALRPAFGCMSWIITAL